MRFRNGLCIFQRTNSRHYWNVASFHSPHSMTWRWIVSFALNVEWRIRPLWWSSNCGDNIHGGFRIPFIGNVSWQTQKPMWYRDLYARLSDDEMIRNKMMWTGPAYVPPGPVVLLCDKNIDATVH